jgi:hypothetical protein
MFCLAPFLYGDKLLKMLRIFIKKLEAFRDLILLGTVFRRPCQPIRKLAELNKGGKICISCIQYVERDSVTRFLASSFFHESSSPKSLKITLGHLKIFRKFSDIQYSIRKSRCTTGINDTSAKFVNATAGVVDTSGK